MVGAGALRTKSMWCLAGMVVTAVGLGGCSGEADDSDPIDRVVGYWAGTGTCSGPMPEVTYSLIFCLGGGLAGTQTQSGAQGTMEMPVRGSYEVDAAGQVAVDYFVTLADPITGMPLELRVTGEFAYHADTDTLTPVGSNACMLTLSRDPVHSGASVQSSVCSQ